MKKKILVITKYFPPEFGGIEILSKNMCDSLSKNNDNYQIDVLCFSKFKSSVNKSENYTIFRFKENFNFFSTPFSLKFIQYIIKYKDKYDIVHVFTPNPLPSILFAFIKSKKLIVTWGSDIINQKIIKFFFKPFQYLFLKKVFKIICLSSIYRDSSKDLNDFYKKTVIIPPLVNNLSSSSIRNFSRENINLLSIGRLVDYKDYKTSILSLNLLPKNYYLTIVGSGIRRGYLENLIKKNSLEKRIKIKTNISEVEKDNLFKKSDIFLQSSNSRAESFGISILEAISNSMPLIISNVYGSGMNEMIEDGYNGFKFKKNDPNDCAKKILLLSNKSLKNFSENSFSRLFWTAW